MNRTNRNGIRSHQLPAPHVPLLLSPTHAVAVAPPRCRRRGRGGPGCGAGAPPLGPCPRRLRARARRGGHLALRRPSTRTRRPARRRRHPLQPLRLAPHQPPRELMGFLDFPFTAAPGSADPRRFPGHEEVLRYLEDFARRFDLYGLVRFETKVVGVWREAGGRWAVTSWKLGEKGEQDEEVYDAVVVCNGHYSEPRVASIPGVDAWPGKQMHSHNYRVPEPFLDQVVIVIGAEASAVDISRDIASIAKEVHIADRSAPASTCQRQPGYDNMWLHPMIDRAQEDGSVVFQDGSSIKADIIMHCTGTITVDDNCVDPLYKHVFPVEVAPDLSFIGLPWKVIPFPLFELQSKWVAGILSGRIKLPWKDEMMEDVKANYSRREARGWPKRYTHNFSGGYQVA